MAVFRVETYVVKPEKQEQFMQLGDRFLKYLKENPETFKEVKSVKLFSHMFGGTYGAYVEMWEYDSLTEYAESWAKLESDKGFRKLVQDLMPLIDPATLSINVWKAVM